MSKNVIHKQRLLLSRAFKIKVHKLEVDLVIHAQPARQQAGGRMKISVNGEGQFQL